MNRPTRALVPEDFKRLKPSIYLARVACAHLRAFVTGQTPTNAARTMFGDDIATVEIIKAVSTQATTQAANWAQELAHQSVLATIQDAASVSAGAAIIARSLSLNLGRFAPPSSVAKNFRRSMWLAM
jgi:hypothetical protein